MRNLYFYLIIIVLFYSCKDENERANDDLKGVWKLESMQYEDSTGAVKVIYESDITLTFKDDQSNISTDDSGIQIIGSDTTYFEYSVSPEYCCITFSESYYDYEKIPLDALGRLMCYNFFQIDKKTIEFSADREYDPVNKKQMFNTSHVYSKISN